MQIAAQQMMLPLQCLVMRAVQAQSQAQNMLLQQAYTASHSEMAVWGVDRPTGRASKPIKALARQQGWFLMYRVLHATGAPKAGERC